MLATSDIEVFYGQVAILRNVSIGVQRGGIAAIIGRNGIGKSSILKAIMGLVPARGEIYVEGSLLHGEPDCRVRQFGLSFLPQEYRIAKGLTVESNLRLAASQKNAQDRQILEYWIHRCRRGGAGEVLGEPWDCLSSIESFLRPILRRTGDQLSGGEEGVVGLVCASIASRGYLLLDEPSAGGSRETLSRIEEVLVSLAARARFGVLLSEQNHAFALRVSSSLYWISQRGDMPVVQQIDANTIVQARNEVDVLAFLERSYLGEPT